MTPPRNRGPVASRPDCIFCQIVAGKAPAEVIARTDRALAFLTIGPLAEGHTLVVPAAHAGDLTEVSTQDTGAVWQLVHDVERRLRAAGLAQGVSLFVMSGEVAEQSVFHLHVHVVPRRNGDGLDLTRWWQERVRQPTAPHQQEIARRLRAAGAPVVG
ncbi:MAG TPA: HIT family protein [Thermoplasmata archaeon]|nr:HIT family protein [Thermoplasmata archaeon]